MPEKKRQRTKQRSCVKTKDDIMIKEIEELKQKLKEKDEMINYLKMKLRKKKKKKYR